MILLHVGDPARGRDWRERLPALVPGLEVRQWTEDADLTGVRYLAGWAPPPSLIARLPELEAIFSAGAGIDHIDLAAVPAHVPVVRLIDPGLTAMVAEYVALGVLALHRDLPTYVSAQENGVWQSVAPVSTSERRVGIMGAGLIGRAAIERLRVFGFPLATWSRSPTTIPGVTTYAGDADRDAFLAVSDILVCLLPLTDQTRGLLNGDLFARLPAGAALLNAARGAHLMQDDLLDALDAGRLRAAMLDVAEPEPLPPDHPLWRHPRVLITPHVAGRTNYARGGGEIAANIRRYLAGTPMRGVVLRDRAY